jgi:hypothetical protein
LLGDKSEPTIPLPVISVTPMVLNFGMVAQADQSAQFFQIENVGNDTLILGDLRPEGSPAYVVTSDASGMELAPAETVDAMVVYQPLTDADAGLVVIPSNDPETPEATVVFTGAIGIPVLEVTPASIDFGWVEVGLNATEIVSVTNIGTAGTTLTDAWTTAPPYEVTSFDPGPLLPGSSTEVAVTFTPTEGGVVPDTLTLSSGIPDVLVPIHGEGVERPSAMCDANPMAPIVPVEEVQWLGDLSSDPAGLTLEYDWVLLSSPAGSTVPMPAGNLTDPNRYGFYPDLPGAYEGELTVTNSYGLQDTCTVQVDAHVLPPVASCSANPPSPVIGQDEVIWVGDASSDPSGLTLTYDWVLLSAPAGSGVPMPAGSPAVPNRFGFYPDLPGVYEAELTVTNSLGEVDTCVAQIDATEILEPVAVCSVTPDPTEAIYGSADLMGDLSWDPGGLALTYAWTGLTRPAGSAATIPAGTPNQPNRWGFVPDVVGFYDFQLVVTNANGVSSPPCVATLEAIPAEELWVEMFWTVGGDDMDLHVVRNGGIGNLRSGQDCYYSNCTNGLAWGPGGPAGDPRLDLDNIGGTGPENINIHQPESITYDVVVHDFPGSVYNGSNDVTVNIYLAGVLAWSDTLGISGENQDVYFATIDWATQTVTP